MTDQYYVGPLRPTHSGPFAAFNTFTTFQDIMAAGQRPILYGGTTHRDQHLELEAEGEYSSLTGAALTIGFYFGTVAVILAQSGTITTGTTPASWPFHMKWRGQITTLGTAGQIVGSGFCDIGTSLVAMSSTFIPITQALRTVAIDTTTNKEIGIGASWGASSVSNSIKCNNFTALLLD